MSATTGEWTQIHAACCLLRSLPSSSLSLRDCWSLPGVWEMGTKVMANDEVAGLIERIKAAQAEYEGKYQQLVKVWQRQTEMINHLIAALDVKHPQSPEWRHEARRLLGTNEQ